MNSDFETVYRTHGEAVLRYALRLVGSRDLAEDIASEVFLEFYRNQASVGPERMPAWFFTVARNRAVDHWRKQATERRYVEEATPPDAPATSKFELVTWLTQEPALKPVHRVCLTLHFVHGMTRAEIAERLNLSETQVKGHLQYAVQLLRKAWDCGGSGGTRGV